MFLIISKLLFIIIILLQTIFLSNKPNCLAKIYIILIVPIIILLLKIKLAKNMTIVLIKGYLILSKR